MKSLQKVIFMKINNIFDYAFKNIKSNKLRSFLTILGLVVGIASVILLVV